MNIYDTINVILTNATINDIEWGDKIGPFIINEISRVNNTVEVVTTNKSLNGYTTDYTSIISNDAIKELLLTYPIMRKLKAMVHHQYMIEVDGRLCVNMDEERPLIQDLPINVKKGQYIRILERVDDEK